MPEVWNTPICKQHTATICQSAEYQLFKYLYQTFLYAILIRASWFDNCSSL